MIIMIVMTIVVKGFIDSRIVTPYRAAGIEELDMRRDAASDRAKGAGGKEDDGADQRERAADGDADEAKGQQEQPDDGVEDQSQQCEGPAEDQEDAPKKEFDHGSNVSFARSTSLIITQLSVCGFHHDQRTFLGRALAGRDGGRVATQRLVAVQQAIKARPLELCFEFGEAALEFPLSGGSFAFGEELAASGGWIGATQSLAFARAGRCAKIIRRGPEVRAGEEIVLHSGARELL